jgi:LytS/YehU family sensor histidine kinase
LLTKFLVAETNPLPFSRLPKATRIYQPIIYGIGLGFAASSFAIIIKLLKYRYLKQKENERLQQQKINTELKIIKTNFHPHFLSDALKNIAHLIRNGSKESPKVILALSELLSYILYDSEKESVSVTQEIQMIKEYLSLEKIFHSDRIIIKLHETGNADDVSISPLILLSLIQNTCEQLLISIQQKLILDIKIKTEDKHFFFAMHFNGYYDTINGIVNPTSALSYALRRIEMLYGKEVLKTNSEDDFFSIEMILEPEAVFTKR